MRDKHISPYFKKIICMVMVFSLALPCCFADSQASLKEKTKLGARKVNIKVGEKKAIVIKHKNAKCRYSFKSDNKKTASVSSRGIITGVRVGTAKITVRQTVKKTGKTGTLGTVKVTVKGKTDRNPVNNETGKPDNNVLQQDNAAGPAGNSGVAATGTPSVNPETPAPETAEPAVSPTVTPSVSPTYTAQVTIQPEACVNIDFSDNDISMFEAEGSGVEIELAEGGYDNDACLRAYNRSGRNDWFGCGMALKLASYVQPGRIYSISCYVKSDNDADITIRSRNNSSVGGGTGFSFPSQVGETTQVRADIWTHIDTVFASPDTVNAGYMIYWDASNKVPLYIDSIVIREIPGLGSEFKDTLSGIFGNVGTCNTHTQMRENKKFTTSQFNSVTMENEMKPQSVITNRKVTTSVPEGYIVPESYKDSKYPEFSFSEIDNVINTAYEYGLRVRFHVLVWHSQSPSFFFRKDYNDRNGYVTSDVMDGRLEYYITNVMKHVYETPHGKDVVYAWDVVNEYFHNYDKGQKSMWNQVYYPDEKSQSDRTNKPEYVKKAFTIAHHMLEEYGIQDKVSLFYNDYNTYEVTNQIIEMINYVNEDGKVCDGVGMQSHLDVKYPTPARIGETIDAFTKNGYEIQITELDVTDYDNSGKQTDYYCALIRMLVNKKKDGADITGLTFWGLCDTNSWRRDGKPLLFSALFCPKDVYYKVIETAQSAWK